VVPINSSLLTITMYSSVITTLVYNETKYSKHDVITEFNCSLNSVDVIALFVPRATELNSALFRRSRIVVYYQLRHVRLSACNSVAPTGPIYIKLDTGDSHKNLSRNSKSG
jgi:hypothetical protein